ncbi:hypothetical protein K8Z61_13015 [Nocardioides sp. TRM66260-LWL]|uniref:hypothetical protein n=1 Tax=Nocardioides sp. TRM66260-LWL TaxID=2874478 RepID=UPI001CC3C093|nr:hypothetical protein [Nocardioides sp. TRM66260-LWL]MBZ5735419.1 hypothetical protein [Nocardioides sp. TRM66260-LWL]
MNFEEIANALRSHWQVETLRDRSLRINVEGCGVFVSLFDFGNEVVVSLGGSVGFDLEPSKKVFRWVAVTGSDQVFGSVIANFNDDGLLDLWARYAALASVLDASALISTVRQFAFDVSEAERTVRVLFS